MPIDVDGRFFATRYQWLDADTLAVIAARTETSPVELLTCQVPAGTCETALELGTFEELESAGFNLPVGE